MSDVSTNRESTGAADGQSLTEAASSDESTAGFIPQQRHAAQQSRPEPESRAAPSQRARSPRTLVNFWLDTMLLMLFVTLGIVAVIVQFVFPPGIAARGWLLWGMSYGQWCSLQFGVLCTLALGVLVHVMLHWTWICGVIVRRLCGRSRLPDSGIQTLYGVGLLIVLLNLAGLIVAISRLTIEAPAR